MARVKRLAINPEMLFHVMQEGTAWRVDTGIPTGARMRGFTLDPYSQILHLFVEHDSFPDIDIAKEVTPLMESLFKKIK